MVKYIEIMRTIVLINEDFLEMTLGQNTSLAYILSAIEIGHEVNVCRVSPDGSFKKDALEVIKLTQKNSQKLIKKYKEENQKLIALNGKPKLVKVKEIENNFKKIKISVSDIDFVIQRLEPMKSPFPPAGKIDPKKYLKNLANIFKGKIFNNPIDCYSDKDLPLILEKKFKNLATPTLKLKFSDKFNDKIYLAKNFGNKIVLKPENAAQGFGVFLIEFDKKGENIENILIKNLSDLVKTQTFKISEKKDLNKIIEILCYTQFCAANNISKNILVKDIKKTELKKGIKSLYGNEILVQPFLEGVRVGDIRINLAKNSQGNFEVTGAAFRKNINLNDDSFTTGIMSGHAIAKRAEEILTKKEQSDLIKKTDFIVASLNGFLKKKYKNCLEIGCDFLLKGDGAQAFLGEANHYCQALIPHSESLENQNGNKSFYKKIKGVRIAYNGGLGTVKYIIEQQIK